MTLNRAVHLAKRPQGVPASDTWHIGSEPARDPRDGEFLVQVDLISLDPAMRGWLDDRKSYLPPVGVGEVMRAAAAGTVVSSRHPRFPEGTIVQGLFGAQRYAVSNGSGVTVVDPTLGTPQMYLGVLGSTGLTAYFGLLEHGQPRPGDTVVVSGAAGAVGSIVGQIARIAGCRTVGLAGGQEKRELLTAKLGYDSAIDYRNSSLREAFADQCPDGIDVYFDNVGGRILNAALANLAMYARIVICGAIDQYNAEGETPGPSNYWQLLVKRATMRGFLVFDHAAMHTSARRRLAAWVRTGQIVAPDTVVGGALDDFHDVFGLLFTGGNVGKLILDISE
jgi:NADPH-dependent curcumin reductase CurA